jgi:hypothetical protein
VVRLAHQGLLVGAASAGEPDRNVHLRLETLRARNCRELVAPAWRRGGQGAKDRFGMDQERRPDHWRSEVALPRPPQVFHRRPWHHLHRVGQGRSHQQQGDIRGAGQHWAEVLREPREGVERLGGNWPRHAFAVPHRGHHADPARAHRSCGRIPRPGFLLSEGEQDPSAHERGESALSRPALGDLGRVQHLSRGSGGTRPRPTRLTAISPNATCSETSGAQDSPLGYERNEEAGSRGPLESRRLRSTDDLPIQPRGVRRHCGSRHHARALLLDGFHLRELRRI